MNHKTATEVLMEEFPKQPDGVIELIEEAKNKTQKEALSTLLKSPDLLLPLPFILFCFNANLYEVISYEEYASLMVRKAKKNKNTGLL